MQYIATHTCGHSETIQLYGPNTERQRRLAWLATRPCQTCSRSAQLATAQSATSSLPALVGSDKQIAWATTIRAQAAAAIDAFVATIDQRLDAARASGQTVPEHLSAERTEIDALRSALLAQTSASYWIEHRGATGQHLLLGARQLLTTTR